MADRWEELEKRCQDCRECSLCETRTNVVFGDGSRTAEIMFVGEGPGAHEELLRSCPAYLEIAQSQLSAEELGLTQEEIAAVMEGGER